MAVHSVLGPGLLEAGYRVDILVERKIIVELKSAERLLPMHEAQPPSYLRLAAKRLGLPINFNVNPLRHGIKRMVNDF